ncbi:MAG: hypothetical protein E7070_09530 [Bacteroidales bacterium]|nr:hypothetical protein [Bacteroidales bacterium]
MKKIYFFVAVCLFSCLNLYCDCDDDFGFFYPNNAAFPVEGGVDTISHVVHLTPYRLNLYEDFNWIITGATDYDWHSSEVKSVNFQPDANDPDSIDCGWFTTKKVSLSEDVWGLRVAVRKNITGKNRHAVIRLYHDSSSSQGEVHIYQDSK